MEKLSALYASALFDLAMERGKVDEMLAHAELLIGFLTEGDYHRMLVHPHISDGEKRDVINAAFAGAVNSDLLGFMYLATEKNRESYILPALTRLVALIHRHQNKVTAKVISAIAPDDGQIAEIKEVLSKKLSKTVEVSMNIDPSVIGGPYILADGYYIDWTVKKRLRDLTVYLKEGCTA